MCTNTVRSALIALKGILPDEDYAREAKEIYTSIKEQNANFEHEKDLYAKRIAALEDDIKGKRSATKRIKIEMTVVKPEPVAKKSCFSGTSLMSPPARSGTSSSSSVTAVSDA